MSVSSYLQLWLLHIEKARRPKTYELYEGLIRNHVLRYIGRRRLIGIERHHIRLLLDSLSGRIGARTLQLVHRVLRYAFSEAVEDGLIERNPCARRDKPKYEPGARRPLNRAEAQRLLRAAQKTDYYVLLYLALVTGMRQGEIFGLRWDCVDLENAYIYVRATLTRDKAGNALLSPPKASRQRRIDVGPATVGLLRKQRREQRDDSSWVFTDSNNEPLKKDAFVRGIFLPLLKTAQFHESASMIFATPRPRSRSQVVST